MTHGEASRLFSDFEARFDRLFGEMRDLLREVRGAATGELPHVPAVDAGGDDAAQQPPPGLRVQQQPLPAPPGDAGAWLHALIEHADTIPRGRRAAGAGRERLKRDQRLPSAETLRLLGRELAARATPAGEVTTSIRQLAEQSWQTLPAPPLRRDTLQVAMAYLVSRGWLHERTTAAAMRGGRRQLTTWSAQVPGLHLVRAGDPAEAAWAGRGGDGAPDDDPPPARGRRASKESQASLAFVVEPPGARPSNRPDAQSPASPDLLGGAGDVPGLSGLSVRPPAQRRGLALGSGDQQATSVATWPVDQATTTLQATSTTWPCDPATSAALVPVVVDTCPVDSSGHQQDQAAGVLGHLHLDVAELSGHLAVDVVDSAGHVVASGAQPKPRLLGVRCFSQRLKLRPKPRDVTPAPQSPSDEQASSGGAEWPVESPAADRAPAAAAEAAADGGAEAGQHPLVQEFRAALISKPLAQADINTLDELAWALEAMNPPRWQEIALFVARQVNGWRNVPRVGAAVRCDVIAVLLERGLPVPEKLRGRVGPGERAHRRAREVLVEFGERPQADDDEERARVRTGTLVRNAALIPVAGVVRDLEVPAPGAEAAPTLPDDLWGRVRLRFRAEAHIPESAFTTWLIPTQLLTDDDGGEPVMMIVSTPTAGGVEWIERRCRAELERLLTEERGRPTRLRVVPDKEAAPVARASPGTGGRP